MSSSYSGNLAQGAVNVSFDKDTASSLDRAAKLLAGFPGGIEKATESALARAGKSGQTMAAKEVGKRYHLKTADFKKYTKSNQRVNRSGNDISVSLSFRGYHVPLIRFKTAVTSTGLIRSQVMKNGNSEVLKHVFQRELSSGHVGLFERKGKEKLPIVQKYGPSVPQMMGANPELANEVGTNVEKVFSERLEHEVTAILNGWRK